MEYPASQCEYWNEQWKKKFIKSVDCNTNCCIVTHHDSVTELENRIADFFGAPYAVMTDSCTSAIELCLRYTEATEIEVPRRTYLSVPMLADKLNIGLRWWAEDDGDWDNFYWLTDKVADAAVMWGKNTYVEDFMCLSFQKQKHLSIGKCGAILCPDKESARILKLMSYDGREHGIPWREQDIEVIGYHYAPTFEAAHLGLNKLKAAIDTPPRKWVVTDWPDLTQMKIFKNGK